MNHFYTRPIPEPKFTGATGAERAAKRVAWMRAKNGDVAATKETRQNFRALFRMARKSVKA